MCTLVMGRDVVAPGTVLVAANRDEDPARPSLPPGVLGERPRLVGGSDRLAGGTWLAIRDAQAVIAILNRRDASHGSLEPAPRDPERRSRGLLVLDVARAEGEDLAKATAARALAALESARYAPFTMVLASAAESWILTGGGDAPPRLASVTAGWHVVTHADLDDRDEPRTAWVMGALKGFAPTSADAAIERVGGLLRLHGESDAPPVCLHQGRMVTVSSSIVWLSLDRARYLHAEGRPCENPFVDHSALLLGEPLAERA